MNSIFSFFSFFSFFSSSSFSFTHSYIQSLKARSNQCQDKSSRLNANIQALSELDSLLTSLQDGLLDAGSSSLGLSFSETTTTLDSHAYTHSSTISSAPSEPPQGPLNATTDLSRANPAFSTTFTIPPFDFKSFTTDNQRPSWLSQPQSSQPLATNNSPQQYSYNVNNSNRNSLSVHQHQDFQLFPSPSQSASDSWPARDACLNYLKRNTHRSSPAAAVLSSAVSTICNPPQQSVSRPSSLSTHTHRLVRVSRPPVPLFSDLPCQPQVSQQRPYKTMENPNAMEDIGLLDFTDYDMDGSDLLSLDNTQSLGISEAPQTVSPQELLLDSSCPPSTSFTDLSTPSFGTPGTFSHDTSPLFGNADDLPPDHEGWDSLFPGDSISAQDEVTKPSVSIATQPLQQQPAAQPEQAPATVAPSPTVRAQSFPAPSPRSNGRPVSNRHSTVSGVTKRTRERQPLPPITVDPSDPVAVKRARNTEAARKSRQRKVELQESLERRIEELEAELEQAKQEVEHWKGVAGHTGK